MKETIQIAIDGPAGTGKSSIAKLLAKKFGNFTYINTGSMYRSIAYFIYKNNISHEDEITLLKHIEKLEIDLDGDNVYITYKNKTEEISTLIRTKEIEDITSKISTYKSIREKMVLEQRKISISKNIIMDGRDIGTVVLPNAQLKIYLDASVEVRAERRYNQLILETNDSSIDLESIKDSIKIRDEYDKNRDYAPLRIPTDAIYIDTSEKDINEVASEIEGLYKKIKNVSY